ncbi:GAF domain-containing protein [Patulibacter sp. SYSU D01012]|uniref:sensor histidine kinase n=1 Tax=Patulibacter sp. SYSU D01012 TaxID=2817381 RepID=UPI001B304333|nr:GAF domain-containing protein [Patulibacter sp. SYSU D01012]
MSPEASSPHQSAAVQAADALGIFVRAMAGIEDATPDSASFYNRLCEAVCAVMNVDRAVLLLYDEGRRRVRPVGAHRIATDRFPAEGVGIEDAPLSRVALEEDRVVDALDIPGDHLNRPDLKQLPEGDLAYVPIAAGGTWYGIMVVERSSGEPLPAAERDALWIAGKVVAFAAEARRATRQQEQVRQLNHRLTLVRQVHEQVIQRLFGVGLVLASDAPLEGEARERARSEVEATQADLRTLLQGPRLNAAAPTSLRLGEEIERLRRAHDTVELRADLEPDLELPASLEPLAQSVLGEAVRNALKHGTPTVLQITVRRLDDAIAMTIDSDGARRGDAGHTGLGLRLAAVEALQVGGLLEFGSRGENEWRVRLLLPATDETEVHG